MTGSLRRPGRPRAAERLDSRSAILAAAAEEFSEHGYEGTSLRAVGRRAGVDPALVHRYFGDKTGLFAAVVDTPVRPDHDLDALLSGPRETFAERLLRFSLSEYEDPEKREQMTVLVRASLGSQPMAHLARMFVSGEVVARFAGVAAGPDPALRADLVSTQLFGLFVMRYVLATEPISSASVEDVVAWVAPTIHRYLFED